MKGIILLAFSLAASSATAFSGERQIAFERNSAVYLANLDGTGERKIADGIFPAISPDGTRVAFNTVEKTSDTTYIRHIAVTDVATGKTTVFQGCPERQLLLPDVVAGRESYPLYAAPKRGLGPRFDQRRRNWLSGSEKRRGRRGHTLFADLGP